ncbi:MAG: V-type ATPase subunit [Nitrososphaerales archaeon]
MSIRAVARFSSIISFVSALKSYMLKPEDYEMLLKSESVSDIFEVLQRTYYKNCLSERERIDVESFERRLYEDYLNVLNRIYKRCPKASLNIIDAIRFRHELYSLKMILRALSSEQDIESALRTIIPIGKYNPDLCRSILESKSIQKAIESVEEPNLRKALKDLFKQQKEPFLSYLFEAIIDKYSIMNIWKSLSPSWKFLPLVWKPSSLTWKPFSPAWKSLPPISHKFAYRIISKIADLSNLMFILRSKYLNLDLDKIRYFIIPIYCYLPPSELERLIQIPTLKDTIQILTLGYYGKLIIRPSLSLSIDQALSEIEVNFDRYIARECLYSFKGIRSHVGVLIAYLMLKFYEMLDLRAIMFGKANKLPVDKIRRMLILYQPVTS